MRWLITAVALVLVASAAAACINDREVESHEREFKSQYLAPRPQESPSPQETNLPLAAAGGGLLLLTAAAVVAGRSA
ncbi:MAG TPA: hypothetical protein VGF55_06130 [Gemmataceae bacterium]|jgi:hypothetical protein